MSVHFQFDPGLGGIYINLSAKGDRQKFWFDLNTDEYVGQMKGMLEVFDRMVKEATER